MYLTMEALTDDANGAAGTKRKYGSDDECPDRRPSSSSVASSSGNDSLVSPNATKKGKKSKSPTPKSPKQRKTTQKNFSKLGRRGDPRMHKSVAARLVNADMPLLRALLTGGFVFPTLDSEGVPLDPHLTRIDDDKVLDADGVTLAQRKNQLSRRIRIAREKIRDECGGDMSEYTDVLTEDTTAYVGFAGVADGRKVSSRGRASVKSEAKLKAMLGSSEARKQADILIRERPDAMDFAAKDNGGGGVVTAQADIDVYQQLSSSAMAVAGLMDSAPEVLYEDPDADLTASGSYQSRTAKDHPMFAQYQASITGGTATATAGLAALGAVASAHAATTSDAKKDDIGGNGGGGAMTDSLSLAAASMGISPEMISMMIKQGAKQASASASEKKKEKDQTSTKKCDEADTAKTADGNGSTAASDEDAKKSADEDAGSAEASAAAAPEVDPEQVAAIDEAKMKIALNVYQTEHSTLLKRCLMIAGFDPSRSEECNPLYIQFAERCAQAEHRRLHRLTLCFQGRHVHRLDGKCGHKAVLHHPAGDDRPHVDFIVNGKVECFRNARGGIKSADGNEALWPSKFSCDDAGCVADLLARAMVAELLTFAILRTYLLTYLA